MPLAIKWVVGQVALGKDLNRAIGDLTSSTGDVAKFCFEHIFDKLLNHNAKLVLYSIASHNKNMSRGVLSHVADLPSDQLDEALRQLTIASIVILNQLKTRDLSIDTTYELLPLTRNYIQSKLKANPEIDREITRRTEQI